MAAPKQKKVNLIVQEGFEYTPVGKVVSWLLSAGRAIVILTELIVIGAFLSRFWFDKQLTDLGDQINARKNQVEAAAPFETQFRNAQERLSNYKRLDDSRTSTAQIVKDISLLLPAEVVLTNLIFSDEKLTINGIALSEAGLAGFMKAIQDSGKYKNLLLTNITLETSTQKVLGFSITVAIDNKKSQAKVNP